jgi:hypothetical protein
MNGRALLSHKAPLVRLKRESNDGRRTQTKKLRGSHGVWRGEISLTTTVLHWYRMVGQEHQDTTDQRPACEIITYVEATTPKQALREYGGLHRVVSIEGKLLVIDYPTSPAKLELLPKQWHPPTLLPFHRSLDENTLERYLPATRYLCTCGKMHISIHPYASVWCSCGNKAFPVVPKNQEWTASDFITH